MAHVVAEGTSFSDFSTVVSDRALKPGQRITIMMRLNAGPELCWAFDTAPNWAFPAPEGTFVRDIWGEQHGGTVYGFVELEVESGEVSGYAALPVLLAAVIGFIASHWVAIVLAGFTLAACIIGIMALMEGVETVGDWASELLKWTGAGLVAVGAVMTARALNRKT